MEKHKEFFENFIENMNDIGRLQARMVSLLKILIESYRNDDINRRDIEVLILIIKDKSIEIKDLINDIILNAEKEQNRMEQYGEGN